MKSITRVTVAVAGTAVAAALSVAPAGTAFANSSHDYTCSNHGGGPNHKVDCSGTGSGGSTVTVCVGDVNVLNGTQLSILENDLNNASVGSGDSADLGGVSVSNELKNLKLTALNTYVNKLHLPLSLSQITATVTGVAG
jgi:hypothetical protein